MNWKNLKQRYKAFILLPDKEDILFVIGFPILFIGTLVAWVVFTPLIFLVSSLEEAE